jgi:hypothetical protein
MENKDNWRKGDDNELTDEALVNMYRYSTPQ